jgi:hypothetical protein
MRGRRGGAMDKMFRVCIAVHCRRWATLCRIRWLRPDWGSLGHGVFTSRCHAVIGKVRPIPPKVWGGTAAHTSSHRLPFFARGLMHDLPFAGCRSRHQSMHGPAGYNGALSLVEVTNSLSGIHPRRPSTFMWRWGRRVGSKRPPLHERLRIPASFAGPPVIAIY